MKNFARKRNEIISWIKKKKKNKLKNRHIMGIVKHTRGKKNYFYDNYVIKKKKMCCSLKIPSQAKFL